MRRTPRTFVTGAGALLLAASAHAQGINIAWNDCGTFGADIESFACNNNTGIHSLVAYR